MPDLKLPANVRVLGQQFQVKVITRDESMARGADYHAVGHNDLNKQIITVRGPEDLSPHQAVDTLLHEVLHAMTHIFHLDPLFAGDGDEDFVATFAPALLHTLRDNPLLVEALLSDLDHVTHEEIISDE